MRCCVLIMGCKVNPGLRNMEAIYDTYITSYFKNKSDFINEYDFYFYDGGNEVFTIEKYKEYANIIHCISDDGLYGTFEKTIETFNYIVYNKKYDWVIRVNISTYVNLYYLDLFLQYASKDKVYANKFNAFLSNYNYLNDVYPRGDAYIISFDRLKKITQNQNFFDIRKEFDDGGSDLVDDVLIGAILLNTFEDLYVEHYKLLNYFYNPYTPNCINKDLLNISFNAIFTRLKTTPPNKNSGYSWDDNEYRKMDVEKFNIINNFIYNNKDIYKKCDNVFVFNNCLCENASKNIPYINMSNIKNGVIQMCSFNDIVEIIKLKYSNNLKFLNYGCN